MSFSSLSHDVVELNSRDVGESVIDFRPPSRLTVARGPQPHVIVFANEKGGVGKSTMAFHSCIALANSGQSVFAVDLDTRQQSLGRALQNREGTARRLKIDFARPRYSVLDHVTPIGLRQEINRLGSRCSFVVIDVAGHDSPLARHAIALADTLVTPVNESFVDIDLLGRFDPVTFQLKELGGFSRLVQQLRVDRKAPLDWLVAQNRLRRLGSINEHRIEDALEHLAPRAGFRLVPGLGERVIYRELFPLGLTVFDLKRIPEFARSQPIARAELDSLIEAMQLPIEVRS
jgi:chromosome partitioning protein